MASPSTDTSMNRGVASHAGHAPFGAEKQLAALKATQTDTQNACPNGIIIGTCDTKSKYLISPNHGDFYTTWSFYMCMIAACLTVFYLLIYGVYGDAHSAAKGFLSSTDPNRSGWVKFMQFFTPYVLTPIIIWGAVNSLGVLATSQQMLGWNFTQSLQNAPADNGAKYGGLHLSFVDYIFVNNFWAHVFPALVAVVILVLLSLGKYGPNVKPWGVMVGCFVCFAIFLGVYLLVPAKNSEGTNVFGGAKVNAVYNNPPGWMFATQICMVVLMLVLVPMFMLSSTSPLNLTEEAATV
jgi:hypothetical protein